MDCQWIPLGVWEGSPFCGRFVGMCRQRERERKKERKERKKETMKQRNNASKKERKDNKGQQRTTKDNRHHRIVNVDICRHTIPA
jgi:hypothetical protein